MFPKDAGLCGGIFICIPSLGIYTLMSNVTSQRGFESTVCLVYMEWQRKAKGALGQTAGVGIVLWIKP